MVAQALFRDFSTSISVDLMPLISSLNSQVSLEICECRLQKLSSIRDSIAFNLSKSMSIEMCVSVLVVFHFFASEFISFRRRFRGGTGA